MDKELILSHRRITLGLEEKMKNSLRNESALLLTFSDAQISYFVHQVTVNCFLGIKKMDEMLLLGPDYKFQLLSDLKDFRIGGHGLN